MEMNIIIVTPDELTNKWNPVEQIEEMKMVRDV